jgi:hypothetical protein
MRKTLFASMLALMVGVAPTFANSLSVTSVLASATQTSVTYVVSITGTNLAGSLVTNLTTYFGSYDGLQTAANWGKSYVSNAANLISISGTNYTNTVFGLTPDRTFYYSVSADDSASGTVWNAGVSGQIVTIRGGFPGASNNAANALLPTGANVTNLAYAGSITNDVALTANSNIIAQANTILAKIATALSNVVNQVSNINSNVHKSGTMP